MALEAVCEEGPRATPGKVEEGGANVESADDASGAGATERSWFFRQNPPEARIKITVIPTTTAPVHSQKRRRAREGAAG